jgi:hypothetical protein
MTSRIHSILFRAALASVLVVPIAGFLVYRAITNPYEPPPGSDVFALVQGSWAWSTSDSNCVKEPEKISFTPDHKGMIITLARPYRLPNGRWDSVASYDIRSVTPASIRGSMRGETRLTADSQLVVWDLVLTSPDRFVWHRTDWASWEHTRAVRRCARAHS